MSASKLTREAARIRRISAGSVILRQENGVWMTLLLRASSYWDFPKGQIEDGENIKVAALREVREETGIEDLSFPWGVAFIRTGIYSRDKVAYYCISQTQTEFVQIQPNPQTGSIEHEEYRWVPWNESAAYLTPRLFHVLDWVSNIVKIPPPHMDFKPANTPSSSCPKTF